MSDPVDRAVDAQIDAYSPDTVPPFSVIEARKHGRDRRRMAVGAGALSVVGLAAAVVVVPSLVGGGDRLTPGQPPAGGARTSFAVQYTATAEDTADPSLGGCLGLPGAQGTASLEQGDPPTWIVAVDGTDEQAADVRRCLEDLRDATVRIVPTDGEQGKTRTFRVSNDGTAGPAPYTAAVEKCLALPGVTGSSVQESYPATYELRASGEAATALAECLAAAPGAKVLPLDDAAVAAGETAVWEIDPARAPQAGDRVIAAMVSRLGCASGETGEVYAPSVIEKDDQVVVTFTVAPLKEGFAYCPANKPVQYSITLQDPLGNRTLVDGACDRKDAMTTSWCLSPQRWPTPR